MSQATYHQAQKGDRARFILVVVLAFIALGPILSMLMTSFAISNDIFSEELTFFFAPTFQNYEEVLSARQLRRYLVNSLIVGTVSTAITLVIGGLAAYALQRFRFAGRDTINVVTLLTRLVPPAVLAVPVFLIWTYGFEISGTRYGLILIYVAINLPFVVWILQSFIEQLPPSLEEAARMDGANVFQTFFLVVLPLIRPGLAAAAIFTFRIAWNEFILAFVLTGRSTRTLPVHVSTFLTEYNLEWGQIMAIGTLIALPPLVFTLMASRQIITGLTAGAVKG
ncbi:MAG: carbohydrate ABC transporter permease [Pseudomonadota bacterium]